MGSLSLVTVKRGDHEGSGWAETPDKAFSDAKNYLAAPSQ